MLAQQKSVPDDASVLVVAGPKTDFFPAEVDMLKKYLAKGGKIMLLLDPPDRSDSPPLTNLIALAKDWGIDVGTNIVVDVSGMGQLLGTDVSVPVAAKYETHPITDRFNLLTAYPLARSVSSIEGGVNGHSRAEPGRYEQEQLGGDRHQAAGDVRTGRARAERGTKPGPVSLAAAVSATATDAPAPAATAGDTCRQDPRTRQSRKLAWSFSAIRISSPTDISGFRETGICSSTPSTGWRSRRT